MLKIMQRTGEHSPVLCDLVICSYLHFRISDIIRFGVFKIILKTVDKWVTGNGKAL